MIDMSLPKVERSTIEAVINSAVDKKSGTVNTDKLKRFAQEIGDSNPEITKYITRASKMMGSDVEWYAVVSMMIMYKVLENQYIKDKAKCN